MTLGFDCGTFNLVCARRVENNEIKCKKEVNAFIEIPKENPFLFNTMRAAKVSLIERKDVAYIVGQAAVNMAYTLSQLELKRPMRDGCVNPKEKDAFDILRIMIHSLVGKVDKNKEMVCYSVPANAVNKDTDADYHQKILAQIFQKYNVENKTLNAHPINEALAIIYAELAEKQYTGIGLSFGSGMVNFCYAIYAAEVCSFSIVNAGDWIDNQAAKATGENSTFINKEKTKIDLNAVPNSLTERAIQAQYQLMIEKTVLHIKKTIAEKNNVRHPEEPIDIIVAGGTASPPGFIELLKKSLTEANLPMKIGDVRKPEDHLYTVAKGCLIAAEVSQS